MENQKEYCEKLFERAKKLKTNMQVNDMGKGGGFHQENTRTGKDRPEFYRVKEELKSKCRNFLSQEKMMEVMDIKEID